MERYSLFQLLYQLLAESLHLIPPLAFLAAGFLVLLLTSFIAFLVMKLNRFLFKRVLGENELRQKFMYSFARFLILLSGVLLLGIFFGSSRDLGKVLLGSTGLLVAIVGFAAQSAIGDIVAGFMISITHPFEVGDKITLHNAGIAGTIRDMTIRHTVIHRFDGLYVIVPNSVMNTEILHNDSYKNGLTASYLEFDISYDSDIATAMKIIHNAVIACRYTVEYAGDNPEGRRAAVYMTGFDASSIKLRTTVWARNADESFMACSDIMIRVKENFEKYGVEIPYNFLNVVSREYTAAENVHSFELKQIYGNTTDDVMRSVQSFCDAYRLKKRAADQLILLAEELMGIMKHYSMQESYFNISMNENTAEMSLKLLNETGSHDSRKSLMSLSTVGTPLTGLTDVIRNLLGSYKSGGFVDDQWSLSKYREEISAGNVSQADIGKSILVNIADDIRVNSKDGEFEIIIYKKVR